MSDPLARNDPNFAPSSIVHRTESSATLGAARVLVLIGGLFLVAMGLLIGSIGILTSYWDPSSRLLMLTASISFMALTMGFGSKHFSQSSVDAREYSSHAIAGFGGWYLCW
jgi:hypothetical protein